MKVSYPSLKPLGSYVDDLLERCAMLTEWTGKGVPKSVWLSGLFSPSAFIIAARQNFARRMRISIDTVTFDFEFFKAMPTDLEAPVGYFIHGLMFEGAQWNSVMEQLAEASPKILFAPAPVIWVKPCEVGYSSEYPHYECPVYRTAERREGQTTNFLMSIRVPSVAKPYHWTMRGVALVTQLSD
jgi:dynein heavy chain